MAKRVAVIINPISGTGGRKGAARERAELAGSVIAGRGLEVEVFVTERPGHARELAAAAVDEGASTVIAWGGDGTVNEVGSSLAFRNVTLGIVPSGSGNGLARELRIPFDPVRAIDVALGGRECWIDAGELDGRLFFNIAGIGLDARVAHRFASARRVRRGFVRYLAVTARELFTYRPDYHTVFADGAALRTRALLVAIANARQYGNGAIIAPAARLTDGRLDVVVVAARSPLAALVQVPRVFLGQMARVPEVAMRAAVDIRVTSAAPVMYHLDGEPYVGGVLLAARPRPGALRVAVPAAFADGRVAWRPD
ncbi:MAG: diacylglycerol kinase family lipid kinase [Acidobacteria bacterium]|nr:diacylglycerol kinase family lipid kinase [Acidobacteriota bacterium]